MPPLFDAPLKTEPVGISVLNLIPQNLEG